VSGAGQLHVAVGGRADACQAAKEHGEMAVRPKAHLHGYRTDGYCRGGEEPFGRLDATLQEVLMRRTPQAVLKCPQEVRRAEDVMHFQALKPARY